ncbi:MAG TPA: MFS transporter [Bacillales bacterium]|nr:MFS transporter [Bacillales bacterium]
MSVRNKIIGKVDISKDLILLLVVGGLYFLSIALSNTFVNVYLWKQSGSFQEIALYNLAIVIMQPLTFILAGKWAKRIDRVIVLRLGVSFLSVFFITVLLLGDHAGRYIFLLGGLLGIGFGFYWLAFNVLTFEITEPETRDFFNGFQGLLSSLAGMIGPISAGAIIASMEKFTGYKTIFSLSLGFFCLAVVLSFFLKRRRAKGNFSFRRIIAERKNSRNWKAVLHAHFFQGLREGTFAFVIVLWVFITTKSALALGTFGLVQSAVSFGAYYLATRLIKKKYRKKAILAGGIILYGAVFLILFHLSYPLLILYAVVIALGYPILLVPYMSLTFDVIGKSWKAAEMRIEYIVVRELYYNAGRVLSILAFFLLVTFFDQQKVIPFLLGVLGAGHLAIYFCIRRVRLKQDHPSGDKKDKSPSISQRRLEDGESGSPV